MLEFFYLGKTKLDSNCLVEMLSLCEEYLLHGLKMAVEQEFINNLKEENYYDIYMIAKGFSCSVLLDKVIEFGRINAWPLRQSGVLKKLDKEDRVKILTDNPNKEKPKEKKTFSFMGK